MKMFTAFRAVGLAGLIVTLSVSRLVAQDVTVSDPAWFEPEAAEADVLPQFKKKPKPDYPDKLEKEQPGYVLVTRYVAEDGKVTRMYDWASHPYFKDGYAWEGGVKYTPATKDGSPVGAVIWHSVIFNPKKASLKGDDAEPRLLAVAPALVPKEKLTKVPGVMESWLSVWAKVKIDAAGVPTVTGFDNPAHEDFREAIERTLPAWKFAPARKGGIAVESEIPVAFVVMRTPKWNPVGPRADKPPEAISRARPNFPVSLRRSRQAGEVLLAFTVDKNGAVKDVVVVRSDHPDFNDPAIEAVMKWKFKPATAQGKPLETKMRLPIVFNLNNSTGGRGAVQVEEPSAKSQAKMPEHLRYDVGPKPKGILYPAYPFELLIAKVSGKVELAFLVAEDGSVSDVKVLSADRPEFGEAFSAAVVAFQFVPAMKDGKPTKAVLRMEHQFDAGGWTGRPSSDDLAMAALVRKHPERVTEATALDSPVRPISQRPPVYPATAKADSGEALIEVIIDKDGRARLPKIVSATEPALGYAAAQAAGEWRFEEPKSGGKAVVARVRVPFKFGSAKKAANTSEAPAAPPSS
jgi:TonB family protein